jgi:hypothetical protein
MLNAQENNRQHAFMKTEKWNLDKLLADIKKKKCIDFFFSMLVLPATVQPHKYYMYWQEHSVMTW